MTELIRNELEIVAEQKYARYFLTVHDIVRYARSKKVSVLCQGRGSAANSVICYCLGITDVDPDTDGVFCSSASSRSNATSRPTSMSISSMNDATRSSTTSIRKYSQKRTALAAAVISYRGRSALARSLQGDGPVRRHPQRIVGLDLGLVVREDGRDRGQGGRPRPGRSPLTAMSSTSPTRSWAFRVTSPSMSAASSSPRTGSTRSCPSSRRRWTSARWSSGTRTTSTRSASSRSTSWRSACCPACAAPFTF